MKRTTFLGLVVAIPGAVQLARTGRPRLFVAGNAVAVERIARVDRSWLIGGSGCAASRGGGRYRSLTLTDFA